MTKQRIFIFVFMFGLVAMVLLTRQTNIPKHINNYSRYIFTSNENPSFENRPVVPLSKSIASAKKSSDGYFVNLPKKTPVKPPHNPPANHPTNPPVSILKGPSITPPNKPPAKPADTAASKTPKAVAPNPPENKTKASLKPITGTQEAVSNGKKYLIYRCTGGIGVSFCSGLGNRQIGIVASFILANATGRTFGVTMNHPCKFNNFMVPNIYNWIVNPEDIKGKTSASLSVRNNRKFTTSLTKIDFNKKYPQDVVYILNNHEYHKQLTQNVLYRKTLRWVSSLPKHLIYRTILNKLFKLHPNVQKKKDAFFQMARPLPISKVMCAQVRMGKNPSIPWDNRAMNSMKGVQNLWSFFEKRDNMSKIFVTSDSLAVIKDAKKRFGGRFVTTDGPIIHIDKAYRGSACLGMEKLLLDQMILNDCDTLVVSSSSFGRIPAFMKTTPGIFLFRGGKVVRW